MRAAWQRFLTDTRGVAALEFALMLPALLVIMYGVIETSRLITINQRIEKVAYSLADITSQNQSISVADLDALVLVAAHQVMEPYGFEEGDSVIITAIRREAGADNPTIIWQYCSEDDALAFNASQIGEPGDLPALPQDFVMDENETVIIAEVFYTMKALIQPGLPDFDMYKTAYYRPRLGALSEISGGGSCTLQGDAGA